MQWRLHAQLLIVLAITLLCVVVVFPPHRRHVHNIIRRFFTNNNDDDFCDNDTSVGSLEFQKDSVCHKSQQQQQQRRLLQKSGIDNANYRQQQRVTSLSLSLPLDATYETSFSIPWIGDYTVQMVVLSDHQATLTVYGDYNLQDVLQYQLVGVESTTTTTTTTTTTAKSVNGGMHPAESIQFSVELSDYLKVVLKDFTVSLATIRYNPRDEIVSVMVSMLHIITFPVNLGRTK